MKAAEKNLKEVGEAVSIFDEARALGALDEGFTVFTRNHRAAVGRLKPVKSGGLWFAVIIYPRQSATTSPLLILTTGLSVVEGIAKTTGLQPLLRWPSEITLHGNLVASVSVEMEVVNDMVARAFAGAGIYVNVNPDELGGEPASSRSSLAFEVGDKVEDSLLLENILQSFEKNYQLYKEGWRTELLDRIRDVLEYVRTVVSVNLSHGTQLIGFLEGFDELGRMVLRVEQERISLAPADVESISLF
ncbi:MAG: hypothetical protein N3H84_00825 [Candidatus Caldarchaeum sp.]|nr:hypothetical protein [Candidatus Caldarchaeum sp.]MCX8200639.1 hypothetical protein [Candidatus Caldarchaeum sp.]MDW8434582.1 hypothetical protein [Candidatus Caldarchaeum sp.]